VRASVTGRLPAFARIYHLSPTDVWALTVEQFMLFCDDLAAVIAASNQR
jgi:hypothetical protein